MNPSSLDVCDVFTGLSEIAVRAFEKWWAYGLVAALGIVLRAIVPMDIVWGSGHDSQLQLVLARNIANGFWLGGELVPEMWVGSQWNLALAKGVGYPLFLVVVQPTGLNPVLSAYLLYLVGALLVARSFTVWFPKWWSIAVFTVLTFSPAMFGGDFSKVYRNNLIAALALLALGLATFLAQLLKIARLHPSQRALGYRCYVQAALLGLCFGALWITRLDVYWIAIACVVAIASVGWSAVCHRSSRLRLVLPSVAIIIGTALVIPLAVMMTNQVQYGIRAVDDFGSGPIAETQILLSKIEAAPVHPLVHVSAEQRRKAAAVSPTMARIAVQLEDPNSNWKLIPTIIEQGVTGESAGWFAWELRDAPVRAGLVSTLTELHNFFGKIEAELRQACESGELQCTAPGEFAPGVRFVTQVDRRQLLEQFISSLRIHSRGAGAPSFFNITPLGIPDLDRLWTDVVNGVDTTASPRQVQGPARLFTRVSQVLTIAVSVAIVLAFAVLAIQRKRPLWTALVFGCGCLTGVLVNAFIVTWFSIEIGVSTENNAAYLFAAQSFFYVGLLVVLAAVSQPLLSRAQSLRSSDIPETL